MLLSSGCFIPGTVLDTEDTGMNCVAPALQLCTARRLQDVLVKIRPGF